MSPQIISLSLIMLLAVLYVPVISSTLRRYAGQEAAAMLLSGYAVVALFLAAIEALWRGGQLAMTDQLAQDIQIYGSFTMSFLLMLTIAAFVWRDRHGLWAWSVVGGIWAVGFILIVPNLLRLGPVIIQTASFTLTRERLAIAWAILGWLVFTLSALAVTRLTHNRSRQPLLRNRLNYWFPVFVFVLVGDILLFTSRELPGNPLRLVATFFASYVIVTHDPPDLRQIGRRVLIYVITTLIIVGFYVLGFSVSQTVFRALPRYNPLIVGAVIALLLSFIFTPLLTLVRRWVNRIFRIDEFDPGRTLHAYSEQISNILDMQRLASVAVGLIIESMDISRGFLFLVDSEVTKDEHKIYRLRAVRSQGERQFKLITLNDDNPIVKHLTQEQNPLLQYDLDLHPRFREVPEADREWFSRLEVEVYLPIFSKREWIGLLALGAKLSNARYTGEDLVTLSALANQTAVALENARLVENLVHLNNELRSAYRALDKANHDLERLDQTKSDFISIASHELRTPLTTMIGYTEMLLEDDVLSEGAREMLKGISKGTRRLHEIMDSMFDLAQIDTRTLQMHIIPVDVASLIKEVSNGLEKSFKDRKQTFDMEVPPLPMIKADPNLLKKLFQHLLTNAVKFTPNNGSIKVSGRVLPVNSTDLPDGGVEIIVSDTGVGVDPDFREIIFSKFYQPGELSKHSTSKTRFKGSGAGLGLALSKGIIEAHGGRIWVESPGYDEVHFPGSQFHMVLPFSKLGKGEETMMSNELKMQIA